MLKHTAHVSSSLSCVAAASIGASGDGSGAGGAASRLRFASVVAGSATRPERRTRDIASGP